jgi:hypothetical protein
MIGYIRRTALVNKTHSLASETKYKRPRTEQHVLQEEVLKGCSFTYFIIGFHVQLLQTQIMPTNTFILWSSRFESEDGGRIPTYQTQTRCHNLEDDTQTVIAVKTSYLMKALL